MRKIKNKELADYANQIGRENYRKIYQYEANLARRKMKNDIRYSKQHYTNSKEKLNSIREKYKNGVTQEIMEEWLGK